jgi:D-alanine-D-alanine ligase
MTQDRIESRKVALLAGGWSDEREISLASGRACQKALGEAGFEHVDLFDMAEPGVVSRIEAGGYDVAFVAMHGRYGEDGCIQGLLEVLRIPYTFSGVRASAIACEKEMAKTVYRAAGIPTPAGVVVKRGERPDVAALVERVGLPAFVKPVSNGSSYGITKVTEQEQLAAAIDLAHESSEGALVEACVVGTEITVPVIGNDDPEALPIIEIVTGAEFYDLKVKYEPSSLHHVCPARLSREAYEKAQEYAIKAHKALGCAGISRSDFIVTADDVPTILETNTIPGMTETSLVPDSARRAGIEFPELCRRIVEMALEEHGRD